MARWRVPIVVLAIALLLFVGAIGLLRASPSAELARDREQRRADAMAKGPVAAAASGLASTEVVVDALRVVESPARVLVEIAVVLDAVRSVAVGAEVAGRVVEIGTEDSRSVGAGALLVRLDPALPAAAVRRAEAGVVRARSASALASQEHGRQQSLSAEGVASEAEFDRTHSEELRTDAQLAEAQALLEEAKTRLDKTRILAPFAGVVSELDLEPGAYVRIGDPVATISDLSEIEVEVGVDDRQILALEEGAAVALRVDAYPGEEFSGTIYSLGRTPDPLTKKYPVPVRVPNPEGRLLPGMLGRVRFVLGDASPTLRIPRRAVYREFEVDYVYVLTSESEDAPLRARRRRVVVRPVAFRPDFVDVERGLAAGDRIATSGVRELREGTAVRVREQAAAWNAP